MDERDRCQALTLDGDRCKNVAREGSRFCHVHRNQATEKAAEHQAAVTDGVPDETGSSNGRAERVGESHRTKAEVDSAESHQLPGSEGEAATERAVRQVDVIERVPTIEGPESYDRNQALPPSFSLQTWDHSSFAVEVATRPEFFDATLRGDSWDPATFFASWDYHGRLLHSQGATVYSLPERAWLSLRAANRLYYRVITSSRADAWSEDSRVSTSVEVAVANDGPFIDLKGGRLERLPNSTIRAEESLWRDEPGE